MDIFLLYTVYHSRETFNTYLPAAHYDTNHVDRGIKIEGCDAHACWKQKKTINSDDKAVNTQSRIFYSNKKKYKIYLHVIQRRCCQQN